MQVESTNHTQLLFVTSQHRHNQLYTILFSFTRVFFKFFVVVWWRFGMKFLCVCGWLCLRMHFCYLGGPRLGRWAQTPSQKAEGWPRILLLPFNLTQIFVAAFFWL